MISALAFAMGHLPAQAAAGPLTLPVVLRGVAVNGLAGLLFGRLFAHRDLPAAMLAHGGAHLGFALAALAAR